MDAAHVAPLLTRDPLRAAKLLRQGQLVAFPTETVYGLGADAYNAEAVRRIYRAKNRPASNPLIVHAAKPSQVDQLASSLPAGARSLMQAFFPGPLTLIVPKSPALPSVTTGGLDTVAIRMPDHRVARTFLLACGTPVAAPSANISGRPTSTTWEAVLDDLGGSIGCLLQDDTTKAGVESTVVDCTREKAVLLRPGVVTLEDLRSILPDIQVREPDSTTLARSPGMRYQHYAPKAHVQLVSRPSEAAPHARSAYIGLSPVRDPAAFGAARHCCTVEDYARTLFWFFRHCESMGIQRIYCQTTDTSGLGLALMDRLTRASPTVTASTATANQSGRTAR